VEPQQFTGCCFESMLSPYRLLTWRAEPTTMFILSSVVRHRRCRPTRRRQRHVIG